MLKLNAEIARRGVDIGEESAPSCNNFVRPSHPRDPLWRRESQKRSTKIDSRCAKDFCCSHMHRSKDEVPALHLLYHPAW